MSLEQRRNKSRSTREQTRWNSARRRSDPYYPSWSRRESYRRRRDQGCCAALRMPTTASLNMPMRIPADRTPESRVRRHGVAVRRHSAAWRDADGPSGRRVPPRSLPATYAASPRSCWCNTRRTAHSRKRQRCSACPPNRFSPPTVMSPPGPARHHRDGSALRTSLQNLAAHLSELPTKVNYGARRRALADWLIPPEDWHHIVEQLQRASNTTQRQRSDWGERVPR